MYRSYVGVHFYAACETNMSTMYRFNENLSADEYARFLTESPAYTFSQLPEWANVKETWGHAL